MVKKGYKQTEVGLIPGKWTVSTIGAIADVKTGPFGSALHAEDYVQDGTPIITVEHLGETGLTHQNLPKVSEKDRHRLFAYSMQEGDIVFSRVGSVDRNAYVTAIENGWLFSGRILRLRAKNEKLSTQYLGYYFKSEDTKERIRNVAVGQTMPSLNTKLMNAFKVVLPTIEEQKDIAALLSNMDTLISALEKQISKKKAIKQGAMQELLTGKRRLPGFAGEWKICRLDEIADFPTATISTDQFDNRFYVGTDNMIAYKGDVKYNELPLIYPKVRQYQTEDIILSNIRPYLQKIWYATRNGGCSNDVLVIRKKDGHAVEPKFLYYQLSRDGFYDEIMANAVGTKMPRGDKAIVKSYRINMPSDTAEQKAIASILSDADAEIKAMEEKLAKYRQVKQGMMQQLLTGKIRLV